MDRDDLIERLAAAEHEGWSRWMSYLLDKKASRFDDPDDPSVGYYILSVADVEHWRLRISQAYAELPKHSKQSDRDEVEKIMPAIVEFVGDWLQGQPNTEGWGDVLAIEWRQQMTAPAAGGEEGP